MMMFIEPVSAKIEWLVRIRETWRQIIELGETTKENHKRIVGVSEGRIGTG